MVNRNILFCITVIAILALSVAWAGEMTEDEKDAEKEGGVGIMLAALLFNTCGSRSISGRYDRTYERLDKYSRSKLVKYNTDREQKKVKE
jgi:hypothetical protein